MRLAFTKLALVGLLVIGGGSSAFGQHDRDHDWERARHVVSRTNEDLRQLARHDALSHKEQERYDNALHHLSDFDADLARGKYDHGRLDTAIDDINNVVKNNTLGPEQRDMLMADLRDLRELRADWH